MDMFRHPNQHDYISDRHREIIKKLKFISRIESGERINVNNISTCSNSLFSSIYRSIFKEGRTKTFVFLNEIVDRSFELIILYQGSNKLSDKITCSQIVNDLSNCITGLKNLQSTYYEDRNFYCDIDTLIGSIFARLAEFYEVNKSHLTQATCDRIEKCILNVPERQKHDLDLDLDQKQDRSKNEKE